MKSSQHSAEQIVKIITASMHSEVADSNRSRSCLNDVVRIEIFLTQGTAIGDRDDEWAPGLRHPDQVDHSRLDVVGHFPDEHRGLALDVIRTDDLGFDWHLLSGGSEPELVDVAGF